MNTSASIPTTGTVLGAGVCAAFEQVRELLEGFRSMDRSAAADEDRLEWVDQTRDLGRRVTALTSVLVAEADEAGSAMRVGHTRLEDWMARTGQETPREAAGTVWAARSLGRRPSVRDAAARGEISLGQAKAINETLDALPTGLDRKLQARAEGLILAEAQHVPAEKLRTMTDKLLRDVAPGLSDSPERRAEKLTQRDIRAHSRRRLWFGPETDGSLDFGGTLPVVAGRRLQSLIQTMSDRAYRSAKDTHNRPALQDTPQQRAADALVELIAEAVVETGTTTGTTIPAGAAQIQVLIPHTDLLDRATASGRLIDGTAISPGELRVLLCDADLIPAVPGTHSEVLDLGHEHRLAPPALRRAIGLRDGGCAFPGCTTPLRHCDIHHVHPWQLGGSTTLGNTVALCRVHHALCEPRPPTIGADGRSVVADSWEVRIDRRGLPEFIPPAALDPNRTPRRHMGHAAALFDDLAPPQAGQCTPSGRR